MKRKIIGLVMVFIVAVTFAACDGKDAGDGSGRITPVIDNEKETEDTEVTPTEAAKDEAPEATETPKASETPEATEPPKASETPEATEPPKTTEAPEETGKNTSLGYVQDGVYINEYMGISCTLDSGWEIYTAEELQDLPDDVKEMFAGTTVEDQMSTLDYITDMSADNSEELTSMNVVYQKMSLYEASTFKGLNDEEIVDIILSEKDVMINTYAQTGMNVLKIEEKIVTFCGEERPGIYMEFEYSGVPYYVIQIVDYDLGSYSTSITLCSFVEDKTEELVGLFSEYE